MKTTYLAEQEKHVPTRSPAHIPASSPPVPALTVNEDKK